MIKLLNKSLLLLAAMTLPAGLASAQTFTSAPETGVYTPQPVVYPNIANGEVPILGDGSNDKGGTPPAFSLHPEPIDPTINEIAGWVGPTTPGTNCLTSSDPAQSCGERKFRTVANSCPHSFKRDDPIRYHGQPGKSHLHEFFVSCQVNAYSTYYSLRTDRLMAHVGPGGPILGTGYWEPAWLKNVDGKVYAMPGIQNTIYYVKGATPNQPIKDELQPLHLLFRFVAQTNMDDPRNSGVLGEIAAANAAIYARNPSFGPEYWEALDHSAGYICENLTKDAQNQDVWTTAGSAKQKNGSYDTYARGFVLPDGTDPWEGRCGVNGNYARIIAKGQAPGCWDGVNVTSPGGYSHVRYAIKSKDGQYTDVCPMHWYKVPAFDLAAHHITKGWNDYKNWRLSSDAMMAQMLGEPVMPGQSFHFDWMNGWNKDMLNRWQSFCLGIGTNVPHDCNSSALDDEYTLLTGAVSPDGRRNPQVDLSIKYDTMDVKNLHLVGTVDSVARADMLHAH